MKICSKISLNEKYCITVEKNKVKPATIFSLTKIPPLQFSHVITFEPPRGKTNNVVSEQV